MQYYETREKDYYDVAKSQSHGQNNQGYGMNHQGFGQSNQSFGQNHQGYGQTQNRPVYGNSPTLNYRSHGGFLDGLFKGQKNGQNGQSGLGKFVGQHKSTHEGNKNHGHGKLLGQHHKKTHDGNMKGINGLGMFIKNGEEKHKKNKKNKNKDGHGSGEESGSGSSSDSD